LFFFTSPEPAPGDVGDCAWEAAGAMASAVAVQIEMNNTPDRQPFLGMFSSI
jgi:hypothetical protein